MVRIIWLESAKFDLKEIFDYISLDSKRYARFQVEKIITKTNILKSNPEIGKIVDEFKTPTIREIIEGNYRIIYSIVSAKEINILLIHHGARNLKRRF
jgi:toxin ParE1/3/4